MGLYIHTGHMVIFNLFQPAIFFFNVPVKLYIYFAFTAEAPNALMAIGMTHLRVVKGCKFAVGSGLLTDRAGVCWQLLRVGKPLAWGVRVILHLLPFSSRAHSYTLPHKHVHGYVNLHNQNTRLHSRLSLGSR